MYTVGWPSVIRGCSWSRNFGSTSRTTLPYTVEERKDRVPAFFLGVKVGLGF
jgi:hypothetical protein